MSKPNEAIGSCPCPIKGCDRTADVLRFREAAKAEKQRRFAGKLFLRCEAHGRIGFDARPALEEFILENATLWHGGKKPESEPAAQPGPAAVESAPKPAAKPAQKPVQRQAQPKREPEKPAPAPAPKSSGLLL